MPLNKLSAKWKYFTKYALNEFAFVSDRLTRIDFCEQVADEEIARWAALKTAHVMHRVSLWFQPRERSRHDFA